MRLLFFLLVSAVGIKGLSAQISYPGDDPGKAISRTLPGNNVILENNLIRMEFVNDGKKITINGFDDKETQEKLKLGNAALFELMLQDSSVITSNDFTLVKSPVAIKLRGDPESETIPEG